jgi:pyruvate,water dikinase
VDTPVPLVVPLAEAAALGSRWVGGKGARLSRLIASGYRVPQGFCITTRAYRRFVEAAGLDRRIAMEMRRKDMTSMRWEELWDAALRIRTAFLRTPIPPDVSQAISQAVEGLPRPSLVVRSSARGEDSIERSGAGVHESVVGAAGGESLLDAVRVVWASLWSDAALLYRRELALDVTRSAMAVVVQELVAMDRSGVGFGRDPRQPADDRQVIEAVPGLCQDLVDGAVDPDRWLIRRSSGEIIEWRPGVRAEPYGAPLLDSEDIDRLYRLLIRIEKEFGWPPDVEWTGRGAELTVLQARPVTTRTSGDGEDQREWYLSLRPGKARLEALCHRIVNHLIPELEQEGRRLAAEVIETLSDAALADALDMRAATFARWSQTYWDEFIPFAHGVRQLGTYYNDAVKPDDAYEFTNILRHQSMLASERDAALFDLAAALKRDPCLRDVLRNLLDTQSADAKETWCGLRNGVDGVRGGPEFLEQVERVCQRYMDVAYEGVQLDTRPDLVLHTLIEMAGSKTVPLARQVARKALSPREIEKRLLDAVGMERHDEARSVIEIARLSWRLRDDDNVLLGRVEKQLLRAAKVAADRLEAMGRLEPGAEVSAESAPILSAALRDVTAAPVVLSQVRGPVPLAASRAQGEKPRQIIGQPAAPGLATARARRARTVAELKDFRAGEVLICDAIQPTMSHIVPLAAAIVERRGGMLIHGAIIARELGIPCVTGVSDAILSIADDEIVTVDGYLGVVTVGPPEFDLETARSA